jgi:hypothetical protein
MVVNPERIQRPQSENDDNGGAVGSFSKNNFTILVG